MEQYICINHLRIRLAVSGIADLDHRHKRQKKWSLFFESFGINPLYLYVQGDVFAVVLDKCGVTPYVYADVLVPLFGNFGGSLAWAILFVVLNWIPGYWLYKKRIYIKL